VAARIYCSLLIGENGDLWVAGKNDHDQLGLGDFNDRKEFVKVPGLNDVVSVSAIFFPIALDGNGDV
jgi:alpha-tubulin suppressor-like RCC1 family protein